MGIALGIARHALDQITAQAVQKGRNFQPSPLSTHPQFQFALGKAELELGAVRALALQVCLGSGMRCGPGKCRLQSSRPRRAQRLLLSPR
jgi:alkylation response protein AidB-like acyl-CoA dehydrogenase